MASFIKKYNLQIRILIPIFIGILALSGILYFLIPILLNYPYVSWANDFCPCIGNSTHLFQVVLIAICTMFAVTFTTFVFTRFLNQYYITVTPDEKNSFNYDINFIKNKLFINPGKLFVTNIVLISITIIFVYLLTAHQQFIATLKFFIVILPFILLFSSFVTSYVKALFKRILIKLSGNSIDNIQKSTIMKKILSSLMPIIFASLLLLSITIFNKMIIENSNSLYTTYQTELTHFSKNNTFSSTADLLLKANQNLSLVGKSDYIFVRDSEGNFLNSQNRPITMSEYFDNYVNEASKIGNKRVFEDYGVDCQAAIQTVFIGDIPYVIGIYYQIVNPSIFIYLAIIIGVLLIINYLAIRLLSKSITKDINIITGKLNTIVDSKNIIKNDKLTITSNDEIGDLIVAYNKVQALATINIKQIAISKDTLTEQERLASLGQMIGGISHNLKTPIFSIAGGIEGLNDLIDELDKSIDNPSVNSNDMHDIAKDMREWTSKIKDYTSYMSDIITAVKGQAVNFSNDEIDYFSTSQLFKFVDLLMKHELQDALINFVVENNVDDSHYIKGSINGIVQVINNIISNSIQAYDGKPNQKIIMKADIDNNMLLISLQDFGPGIPKDVQTKLFKEMVTTKGKNGTGLGLFMSYSNIKAHYHGNLSYKTELGNGTTFYIELPIENRKKI